MADAPAIPEPVVPEAAYFVDSGGAVRPVPADQAADAEAMGWAQASPEQIREHQIQAKYGDAAGEVGAASLAAARALTLGLSDVALTKSGAMTPEDIKGYGEANPGADTLGTVAGIAAPLLLTGGAAAPAEGAAQAVARAAAPALVSRAGQAVTKAVEAALPAGEGLAARALSRAVSMGAGSAIEGAAYGAGQVVSEAALGDPNLTAQSALATIGISAALGGGLGAALGVAHEVVPAAVEKTRDAIGSAFGKAKTTVEDWYAGAEGVHGVNPATAQLVIEHKLELAELEHAAPGITETLTTAKPAVAASIIENAPQFGALEREFPGVAKTLSKTRPDTLSLILGNTEKYANLEREFPGTLRQLSAAEPSTAQYLADNWQKIIRDPVERARLSESVRKSGQQIIDSTDAMLKKAYGEMMTEGAEDLLADANPSAILDAYEGLRGKAIEAVKTMEDRPSLFDPYYPAKLRVILEDLAKDTPGVAPGAVATEASVPSWGEFTKQRMGEYMKRLGGHGPAMEALSADYKALKESATKAVAAVERSPDYVAPRTAFKHLVRLRQEIGDKISWGKSALIPPAERDAQQLMKGLYRDLSDALRSEEVFGQAGARKAELDEAFSSWKRLTERRPGAQLGKSEKGTTNFNFLLMQSGSLSPNKMNAWFKHLADDTGALKTEAWSQMMDAARRATDAVENLHQAAPVTSFDRSAIADLIDKTGKVTADAREKFAATQVMDQLNPRLARSMHEALAAAPQGAAAADALGGAQMVAGLLGHGRVMGTVKAVLSPVSTAVDTARSFPRGVAVLASLERMGQKISHAIDSASSTLVRGGVRAESVGRAEVVAGIAREFASSAEDSTKRFGKRVAEIQKLSSDPEAMHKAIVSQNEGLDEHAPQTSQALAVASARAISCLASKIPQHPQKGPLAPKWEPSQSEIAKFARYYEATQDPLVVLKQAAAGTLTPEAVEAVQAVYPDLFSRIRAGLVEKMATHGTVPRRSRLALSMLLGQDMDGSISMLQANQAVHQGPSQKQNPMGAGPKPSATGLGRIAMANRMMTPAQQTAARQPK